MEKSGIGDDLTIVNRAVTLGKFDGVHLGHRKLMEAIVEKKNRGLCPTVFSFEMPPSRLFQSGTKEGEEETGKGILSRRERELLLESLGISTLVEYPVNRTSMSLSPEDFVEKVLRDRLHAAFIAVGEDFRFGRNRAGDVDLLASMAERCGYELKVVEKERMDGRVISSSRIKECLKRGDVENANRLLGHDYGVEGEIVYGNQLGRTWNVPTINVPWQEDKLAAARGVYFSRVTIEGARYFGMTNLGRKPTIQGEYGLGTETYLYDFSGDLYGKRARVDLLFFRRPERKFDSLEALKAQLHEDVEAGRNYAATWAKR